MNKFSVFEKKQLEIWSINFYWFESPGNVQWHFFRRTKRLHRTSYQNDQNICIFNNYLLRETMRSILQMKKKNTPNIHNGKENKSISAKAIVFNRPKVNSCECQFVNNIRFHKTVFLNVCFENWHNFVVCFKKNSNPNAINDACHFDSSARHASKISIRFGWHKGTALKIGHRRTESANISSESMQKNMKNYPFCRTIK